MDRLVSLTLKKQTCKSRQIRKYPSIYFILLNHLILILPQFLFTSEFYSILTRIASERMGIGNAQLVFEDCQPATSAEKPAKKKNVKKAKKVIQSPNRVKKWKPNEAALLVSGIALRSGRVKKSTK